MPSFIGYTEHCLEQAVRPIEDDGDRDHAFLIQGRLETDLREEPCANTERLLAIITTNIAAYDRRTLEAQRVEAGERRAAEYRRAEAMAATEARQRADRAADASIQASRLAMGRALMAKGR